MEIRTYYILSYRRQNFIYGDKRIKRNNPLYFVGNINWATFLEGNLDIAVNILNAYVFLC